MSVQAGNKLYRSPQDVPETIPVFPLAGALLLPNSHLPLNIFEARYLEMVDAAMVTDRLIGIIQPDPAQAANSTDPGLCNIGCLGRIISYSECGDGRYFIKLAGVSRFAVTGEVTTTTLYRCCRVDAAPFADDFDPNCGEDEVDRDGLLDTFRRYLKANDLDADWESIERASTAGLVNALCMMSPYGPTEKQALLEAPDLRTRAETLIAITEIELADNGTERLQ